LIDLHTHTTASDGRCTPAELVARAAAAGVTVLSVTDHDTVAGYQDAAVVVATAGMELVPGIEITAVVEGADVHVLGYFIDVHSPRLLAFLAEQRRRRIDRVRQIIGRLAAHGIVLDSDAILQPGLDNPGIAIGRPWIARALVAGGYVTDSNQAFDRWLGRDRPAFIPRQGVTPKDVVSRIHEASGIASLAHPGLVEHDEWLPGLAADGLDALEAYHSNHDSRATAHYLSLAASLGLAVTGGSDYHADESHGSGGPGSVSLPREAYEKLVRLKVDAKTPDHTRSEEYVRKSLLM
jgi:predicted metal-dependent phosphoesterase TrpH